MGSLATLVGAILVALQSPAGSVQPASAPAPVSAPPAQQQQPGEQIPPAPAQLPPVPADANSASRQVTTPAENDAIIVTARHAEDPLKGANEQSFKVTETFDRNLVAPVTKVYVTVVPKPVRGGLHNVIRNLGEPVVFINDLLQLHPGRALKTLARFGINSTIGVGGLFDVAKRKPFHIPYHHNGFANTLGYYGIKPGPYFYLPFIGPTTLRDLIGGAVDGVVLPVAIGAPFTKSYYTIPNGTIRSLDRRVEFDCQIALIRAADNPYLAERSYYLDKRRAEIEALHGRGPGVAPLPQCAGTLGAPGKGKTPAPTPSQTPTQPAVPAARPAIVPPSPPGANPPTVPANPSRP